MERQSPRLTLLTEPVIDEIIDEAMGLLEKTGVTVEEPETLDLLGEMGADLVRDEHVAKFKRGMVEKAVASAPKTIELYGMSGERRFAFGDGQIHFNPGSAALFILDLEKSVMRKPAMEDVARFAKLSHTLEHIEAASTGVIPSEVPEEVSDSIRLFISCLFSDKPVVTGTFSKVGFDIMRDLLLARTGEDALRAKPVAIFDVCPTSPLRWSDIGCHDLRLCAQNAIPAELISMPLAGALAPMSLVASVVQHTVETLSGVVIHQAWTPGSPIIWGGSPAVFDMRHSTSPMGALETLMIDLGDTEVGKHLGLPTQAYLGLSDSKMLDAQAGIESAMTMLAAAAGSVDFVSGPGMLNFESCQSLEKLVLDNEICGMVRRFKRGLASEGDTIGIDAIIEGLKEGNFLTTDETLKLYRRECCYPGKVIDRRALKDEGPLDPQGLVKRAMAEVEARVGAYEQPAIPEDRLNDMLSVMGAALDRFGAGHIKQNLPNL
jgi:trimethylamine--corrinoid protein Co-methyltransferase